MRTRFNDWLRSSDLFDGCVDLGVGGRVSSNNESFAPGFDSGDHLHPSETAYAAMADCVPEELL